MKNITSSRNKLALAIVFSLSILNSTESLALNPKNLNYKYLAVVGTAIVFVISKRTLDAKRASLASTKNAKDNAVSKDDDIMATSLDFIESLIKPIVLFSGLIKGIEAISAYIVEVKNP